MSRDLGPRGVSETVGVATLVLITVLVTASVGIGVLFIDDGDSEGVQANFTFDYQDDSGALVVTHSEGDEIPAGDLVLSGPSANVTWAEAAGWNESRAVSQGDIVQLSGGGAYGQRVSSTDTIRVVYAPEEGNETVLSTWDGTDGTSL